MSLFSKIFGDPNKKVINEMTPIVAKINSLEEKFSILNNDELKKQSEIFKQRLSSGQENLDNILPEAFAVCREAAKRNLGVRHFDSQLVGGIVLHRGQIAEMCTGEGKTLTATLPVYLNALTGKGVHVITVNDYLAQRDTVWMGQIYHALGLSVGCIQHESAFIYDPTYLIKSPEIGEALDKERDQLGSFKIEHEFLRPCARQEAYQADIVYGTNNEYGFDYLRDNMVSRLGEMVQRELFYAVIDEVDSILIDEARTPLIISAPAEESADLYNKFAQLVIQLTENEDYNIDEKMRAATLTEQGIARMEKLLGVDNIYTRGGIKMVHHLEQALKAQALYKKDKDYVVKDGEVIIVDEFTGRMMYGRRYSEGLHQAIEAKEGVQIQRESQTLATITFQNYFRLYKKLSGMSGTAATEAEELSKIYKLEVVSIPTNKPLVRKDLPDRIYKNELGKFNAIVQEIKECNKRGQPVLVGTASIEKNELLSALLQREGVTHQVLNAKFHEKEAEIIAQAGRVGAVTIATNMAGRGVDIILGGNPVNKEEAEKVRASGGLAVIGSERHEARRIDNQLRGRAGRQGDPGSSQFYVSLDDDLMRIFGSDRIKGLMDKLGLPDDLPIENKMISRSIEEAQKKVEGHNFDIRKYLVEYDDVVNKHRDVVYQKRKNILSNYERMIDQKLLDFQSINPQQIIDAKDEKDKSLKQIILEMINHEIEQVVSFHTKVDDEKQWDIEEIYQVIHTIFPVASELRLKLNELGHTAGNKYADSVARTKIINHLLDLAIKAYDNLEQNFAAQLARQSAEADPGQVFRQIEKHILVNAIDSLWIEHLEAIDYVKHSIGLRGYGQRDPLVEYKKEAFKLFTELLALINKQVVYTIYKVGIAPSVPTENEPPRQNLTFSAPPKTSTTSTLGQNVSAQVVSQGESQSSPKVGRNDACPCGSGKKYKHCHGA